jgi:hypothetical protein
MQSSFCLLALYNYIAAFTAQLYFAFARRMASRCSCFCLALERCLSGFYSGLEALSVSSGIIKDDMHPALLLGDMPYLSRITASISTPVDTDIDEWVIVKLAIFAFICMLCATFHCIDFVFASSLVKSAKIITFQTVSCGTQSTMLTAFFAFSSSTILVCGMVGEILSLGFYRSNAVDRQYGGSILCNSVRCADFMAHYWCQCLLNIGLLHIDMTVCS